MNVRVKQWGYRRLPLLGGRFAGLSGRLPNIPSTRFQERLIQSWTSLFRWLPLAARRWVDTKNVHGVNLFKRAALRLADEEVDEDGAGEAHAREDVAVPVADSGGDVRREEGDEKIPRPIRRGREPHTLGSIARRIDLADDSPRERTPRCRKAADEQTSKDDHGRARLWRLMGRLRIKRKVANRREDHQAHEHPKTSDDERYAATEFLDDVKPEECRSEIDRAEDYACDVGILQAGGGKDACPVVKEEVGAGQLLKHLYNGANDRSPCHSWRCENLVPLVLPANALCIELLLDLFHFTLDLWVIIGDTVA